MFIAQSILKTSFDVNEVQAAWSGDHCIETSRPHQNVSRKKVVVIAHPVKAVTPYSVFRSQGMVGGMSLKYNAKTASLGQ